MTIILVFAGGILGGITRYMLGKALPPYLGTLIANMCACLTLGIIARLFEAHSFAYAAGGVGFAGALSTWSTLANELGHLLKTHNYRLFAGYLTATIIGGLAALQLGLTIGTIMT